MALATIGLGRGVAPVPSLGNIANDPLLAITDEQGILDANGLALLDALPDNDLLVFTPDGSGGYQIVHNPLAGGSRGEPEGEHVDALFADDELLGDVLGMD